MREEWTCWEIGYLPFIYTKHRQKKSLPIKVFSIIWLIIVSIFLFFLIMLMEYDSFKALMNDIILFLFYLKGSRRCHLKIYVLA